jgi:crotonobetainyl-CoA:carnitine CoA-transferase CaiB-like acyl-CoA transferase
MGSKHPNIAPYQAFETQDGYVVVAVGSESLWPNFCRAIDREDLIEDPRFETNSKRVSNRDELDPLLAAEIGSYTTEEVLELFDKQGLPASRVRNMEDIFDDPQVQARNMHQSVDHPTAGEVEMPGSPMHFSRTPSSIRQHPPLLGEHTNELLEEFGYSAAEIKQLDEDDVIAPYEDGQ